MELQAPGAGRGTMQEEEEAWEVESVGPAWLRPLLEAKFFHSCDKHLHLSRSECNLYCLDCQGKALCSPCTTEHRSHRVVQIRRSSYHNVVRAAEVQKVLDLSGVQTYVINSAKVVFLNQRPLVKPPNKASSNNVCSVCDRALADTNHFYCSLECKLIGITRLKDTSFTFLPRQPLPLQRSKARQHHDEGTNDKQQQQQQQQPKASHHSLNNNNNSSSSNNYITSNNSDDSSNASVSLSSLTSSTTTLSPQTPPPPTSSSSSSPPSAKRRKGVPRRIIVQVEGTHDCVAGCVLRHRGTRFVAECRYLKAAEIRRTINHASTSKKGGIERRVVTWAANSPPSSDTLLILSPPFLQHPHTLSLSPPTTVQRRKTFSGMEKMRRLNPTWPGDKPTFGNC